MKSTLYYNQFFAYSENGNKYFYSKFEDGFNVIHGRNTSGKSTLIQAILFTMGINDEKQKLSSLLSEEVIFRLDTTLKIGNASKKIIFIREDEIMTIKAGDEPIRKFNGIGANNSVEHTKLKEYLHGLFGFTLNLESKSGYGPAPIETMFLPYYVSQSVGWVYLRKSFSSLDFYKHFKEDFLDYYLGIDNFVDRKKKQELEKALKEKQDQISFFTKLEKTNDDFQVAKISDENFTQQSVTYINAHKDKQDKVIKNEKDYVLKCNELSYFTHRLAVLSKVSKNTKDQNPDNGNCPTCSQNLPSSIMATYKFLQEENDTEKEKKYCKEQIKKLQSSINALQSSISEDKEAIGQEYKVLQKYTQQEVTFDTWLKNKANVKLVENVTEQLGELTRGIEKDKKDLEAFKTDEDIKKEQAIKSKLFKDIFLEYTNELVLVNPLEERRFTELYEISSFPSQGVELLKTVMAYHIAFNKVIADTSNIHRFPFMLDAILKEDIDKVERGKILKFVYKHRPTDTQLIVSIAEFKDEDKIIESYNKDYFDSKAHLICIGDGTQQRAFLREYKEEHEELLKETLELKNEV